MIVVVVVVVVVIIVISTLRSIYLKFLKSSKTLAICSKPIEWMVPPRNSQHFQVQLANIGTNHVDNGRAAWRQLWLSSRGDVVRAEFPTPMARRMYRRGTGTENAMNS